MRENELKKVEIDLDYCNGLLDQAIKALDAEIDGFPKKEKENKTIKGCRFKTEKNAVKLTRLHMQRWFEGDINAAANKALRLLGYIKEDIAKLSTDIANEKKKATGIGFRRTSISKLIINALQCVHLCIGTDSEEEAIVKIRELQRSFDFDSYFVIDSNTEKQSFTPHKTFLAEFYLVFAQIFVDGYDKDKVEKELQEFLPDQISEYTLLPYDRKRFSHLHNYISGRLVA